MNPYFAIILDSLREALASRVLWVLVVGITIVLLALAPLGYRAELTTEFLANNDLYSPQRLAVKLRSGRLTRGPACAIWKAMNEGQQNAIRQLAAEKDDAFNGVSSLRRALNGVILDESPLYKR